jgi:hypothetical protein
LNKWSANKFEMALLDLFSIKIQVAVTKIVLACKFDIWQAKAVKKVDLN